MGQTKQIKNFKQFVLMMQEEPNMTTTGTHLKSVSKCS